MEFRTKEDAFALKKSIEDKLHSDLDEAMISNDRAEPAELLAHICFDAIARLFVSLISIAPAEAEIISAVTEDYDS